MRHISHPHVSQVCNVYFQDSNSLWLSASDDLYSFDLRGKALFLRQESGYSHCECEDINQITGSGRLLGLSADEYLSLSASVILYDTATHEAALVIESAHESVLPTQICTSVAFHPTSPILFSGGFDSIFRGWDTESGSKVTEIDVRKCSTQAPS